jgi:hypothetical protein
MLLIYPPVAKPSEPPAGIARLAATLHDAGLPCRVLDGNCEGLLWLMEQPWEVTGSWNRRAVKNRERHLATLREPRSYSSPDRYGRAVSDLNRLLTVAGQGAGAMVGLADYQQQGLSPLRSADLLSAAGHPEQNPFFPWFSTRLPQLLDGIRTVGFSLNYLSQALCTFAMIGYVRQQFPGITVALGGGLVTSWMKRPGWISPFGSLVTHLVAGPGEAALLSLAGAPEKQPRHVLPAYGSLPLRDYLAPGLILPYNASSGCWWNSCSFCPERAEGNPYLPLPVRQVLTDLRSLTATEQPLLIHLLDNAITPSLLQGLADNPPGAPWYGFARFGAELADPAFCVALRASGCVMLKLGLESGDQGVLDRLHKGIELSVASQILMNLKRAGIAVYLYLLFGTPAETEIEARRTLEFIVRHGEAIGFLNLAIFNMPIWGDEAADMATEPFYGGDLSLYTGFRHPRGWDRKQVRLFLDREFKKEPAVATILRNDPPLFTSNHAPLFT